MMNRFFGPALMLAGAAVGAGLLAPAGAAPPQVDEAPSSVQASQIALGQAIYQGRERGAFCSECHGPKGQGTAMGPSLAGSKWLWGDGSVQALAKTIQDGVAEPKEFDAAMPPMGGTPLSPDDVNAVAAYVWSIGKSAE